MSDADTLTAQAGGGGAGDQATVDPAPVTDTGRRVDGATFWAGVKDASIVVVVAFFAVVWLGVRAIGFDGGSGGDGSGRGSGPVELSLTEFAISGDLEATPGPVLLHIVNNGTVAHNIVLPGLGLRTANLEPGEETTLDLGRVTAQSYQLFCDLPGHRSSGMEGDLNVSFG